MATMTSEIELELRDIRLEAELVIPDHARGLVVFAHGSGSTRHTYRNCDVAAHLQAVGFATLLFNLLTRAEEAQECIEPRLRYDVRLLARRLVATTRWLRRHPETEDLRIGLFGASTGATAALLAAAELHGTVEAVVARGGRPDMVGDALRRTVAPTLLVVGGWDDAALHGNREAFATMFCEKQLEVIPNATHRFEEPGAIARVANLAANWFDRHLAGPPRRAPVLSGSSASSFALS